MRTLLALLIVAWVCQHAPAAAAAKERPTLVVDSERGFALELPAGWATIEQDTGQGDREPVLRAAKGDQFMVVLIEKGPTDDAQGGGAAARANFEAGFGAAPGYARLSIKSHLLPPSPGGKPTLPVVDLWFRMVRDGKPVVVGVRGIFYKGYVLTLVVDCPGKRADTGTRRLLGSFHPIKSTPPAKPAAGPLPAPSAPAASPPPR